MNRLERASEISEMSELQQLCDHVAYLKSNLMEHQVLDTLDHGGVKRPTWMFFLSQRCRAAESFVMLLRSGIEAAHSKGYTDLLGVLQDNLEDEAGQLEGLTNKEFASHAQWRMDLCRAVGINDYRMADLHPHTEAYRDEVVKIASTPSPMYIAGALLFQEVSLVDEFRMIRNGLYKDMPRIFLDLVGDPIEERVRKKMYRKYLDHHIGHDQVHSAELESALSMYLHEPDALVALSTGAQHMYYAKEEFYDGFNAFFSSPVRSVLS